MHFSTASSLPLCQSPLRSSVPQSLSPSFSMYCTLACTHFLKCFSKCINGIKVI